ncbi:hypothetical protein MNB_SV-10-507 [hydrothermal vent metagenome]|uniref:Uncharacterized protein n=1 Tax=hydrothermal vent metagenome TaxID=652676 RepID=A0A1W1BUT3_9ZZZZ
MLPWGHSGFLYTSVLFYGSPHGVIDCSDILAFVPVLVLIIVIVSVLVVVRFFVSAVLCIFLVRVWFSALILAVSLPFLSVRIRFPVGLFAWSAVYFMLPLGSGIVWLILSVGVWSSVALRFIFLRF